jgi:hypothetical protein
MIERMWHCDTACNLTCSQASRDANGPGNNTGAVIYLPSRRGVSERTYTAGSNLRSRHCGDPGVPLRIGNLTERSTARRSPNRRASRVRVKMVGCVATRADGNKDRHAAAATYGASCWCNGELRTPSVTTLHFMRIFFFAELSQ